MTAQDWIEKYSGWPEDEETFANSITTKVEEGEDLRDLATAYLEALQAFRDELETLGFEPG